MGNSGTSTVLTRYESMRLRSLRQICCCWVLRHFLTSKVISVASDIERESPRNFAQRLRGSFTCRKSTTRDPRLYFPSEGSHTQDFYALKKSIEPANLGSRGEYDNHWNIGVDLAKVKEPLRRTRYNTRDELIRAIELSIWNINKDECAAGVRRLPNI